MVPFWIACLLLYSLYYCARYLVRRSSLQKKKKKLNKKTSSKGKGREKKGKLSIHTKLRAANQHAKRSVASPVQRLLDARAADARVQRRAASASSGELSTRTSKNADTDNRTTRKVKLQISKPQKKNKSGLHSGPRSHRTPGSNRGSRPRAITLRRGTRSLDPQKDDPRTMYNSDWLNKFDYKLDIALDRASRT